MDQSRKKRNINTDVDINAGILSAKIKFCLRIEYILLFHNWEIAVSQ